jgi:hypothetical protein
MNVEQLRTQAKITCEFYRESWEGELIYCTNKDNVDKYEDNCHPDTCPLLDKLTDAIDDLFGDGTQFN